MSAIIARVTVALGHGDVYHTSWLHSFCARKWHTYIHTYVHEMSFITMPVTEHSHSPQHMCGVPRFLHVHFAAGVDSAKRYTLKHRLGPSLTYIESDEFSENGWEEVRAVMQVSVCVCMHA